MKLIISTLFIFLATTSNAQLLKNNKLVGGSFSISINDRESDHDRDSLFTVDYSESFNWSLSPYIGLFIKDSLALGGGITVGKSNRKSMAASDGITSNGEFQSTTLGAFAFARKYFPIKKRFGYFLQGSVAFDHRSDNSTSTLLRNEIMGNSNNESNSSFYSTGLSFNLYYFVLKKFTLETNLFQLNYSHRRSKNDYQTRNSPQLPIQNSFHESTNNSFNFSFFNNFSFDRAFTINYYF